MADSPSRRRQPRNRNLGGRNAPMPSYSMSGKRGRNAGSLRGGGVGLSGGGGRGLEAREVVILISLAAIFILLLVLVINGVRGCVAGRSATPTQETQVQSNEEEKPAVNKNVSEALAGALATRLDLNEQLATIARAADSYGSENLVYLALEEPSAIPFVSAYPKAPKEALEFGEQITKGTVPKLYTYDSRWGNISFAGDAFAITGSGPTCVSMAYMGLTGSTSQTPNALANLATSGNFLDGATVNAAFFEEGLNGINGMACNQVESNITGLSNALANGNVVVIRLPANSPLGTFARHVLAVSMTEDGAIVVHDPLSAVNSSHEWAAGTLSDAAEAMFAITATETPVD